MTTTPIETWAVDLADVTAIYPLVGSEVIMAVIGIVLWLGWHVWQCRFESQAYSDEVQKYGTSENIQRSIDGD